MNQVHLKKVILPELLAQQPDIYLPSVSGAMWFLSCKIPLSSPPCKDCNGAWLRCLHSAPPSVLSSSAGAYCCLGNHSGPCSIQGVEAVIHPIISITLQPVGMWIELLPSHFSTCGSGLIFSSSLSKISIWIHKAYLSLTPVTVFLPFQSWSFLCQREGFRGFCLSYPDPCQHDPECQVFWDNERGK